MMLDATLKAELFLDLFVETEPDFALLVDE